MPMAKTDHLSVSIGWINLEFVERERTPREVIETGILFQPRQSSNR